MGDKLVVRLAGGRVVAFSARCPHQRTDLGEGCLVGERIRCALHHYEYDVTTGENVVPTVGTDPADLRKAAPGYLPLFAVEERDGWIRVASSPLPPPPSYEPVPERRAVPDVPSVKVAQGAEVVRAVVGTTFELRLPASSRPGFAWRVDTGGSCLAVVGERSQPPDHLVRLAARAAGRSTVRCLYARPWDREPAEVRAYEVVVSDG